MLLQSIIQQGSEVLEIQPQIEWQGALDGQYPLVPDIQKTTLFVPSTSRVNTYNHHQQSKQYYGNDIHVMWSTHEGDEQGYGFRIWYTKSTNEGATWSAISELLEAQDDSTKDFTSVSGRHSIASCFAVYNNELYAIVDINDLDPNAANRYGVGVLAIKVNSNGTFGTPVWIDTPSGNMVSPSPISGYPSYNFASTQLRNGLRNYMLQPGNLPISYISVPETDPLYARGDFNGNVLAEPTECEFPNGQRVKLWKGNDGFGSGADFKIAQTSENGINWNPPYETGIPDVNSRTRLLRMQNNNIALVGNNQGTARDPLYFAQSVTGKLYFSPDIYQIDNTTYAPQFSGQGKGRGAQHPTLMQLNSGKICVIYNWNKEEVYCAVFDAPIIN